MFLARLPAHVARRNLGRRRLRLGGSSSARALLPFAIAALARTKGQIRHRIGKEITLKHTPDLRFMIDETYDRMDETRRLLADPQVRADVEHDEEE